MEQYIPKAVVLTEIKKIRDAALMRQKNLEAIGQVTVLDEMVANQLNRIISFIDNLEVKEVNLDKSINDYFKDWQFDDELDIMVKPNNYSASFTDLKEIAKHFFELGLVSQLTWQDIRLISEIGEEFMNSEESDSCTDDETYYSAILNKFKQLGRGYKTQIQEIRELNKTSKVYKKD